MMGLAPVRQGIQRRPQAAAELGQLVIQALPARDPTAQNAPGGVQIKSIEIIEGSGGGSDSTSSPRP